jgi:hypothetical protein
MSSQWPLTFGLPNQKPVNTSPLPHACHMSRPPHRPRCNQPNIIWWRIEYRLWSSSLWKFPHDPSSSLLGPNNPLDTLFLKTLSLCSSLKVGDQVWRPYNTTGKITVLYILILIFYMRREDMILSE